jgi:hypothetical protein
MVLPCTHQRVRWPQGRAGVVTRKGGEYFGFYHLRCASLQETLCKEV